MSSKLVLVLNCGSSSLKFAIIDVNSTRKYLSGLAECFHLPEASIKWKIGKDENKAFLGAGAAHKEALDFIVNTILTKESELFKKIIAIGHRVVHGGKKYTASVIIDQSVIQEIKNTSIFAPLHNPAHLIGITESLKFFPKLKEKNVAVFDTAFHQTMPEESYLYALPYDLYKKYSIRRYGFHGINHYYVMQESARMLNKSIEELNIITCHLGNGSSLAAIRNGKCIDTSMGLTPMEGLIMGTRSGDIDPTIIFFLYRNLGMNMDQISDMLTKKSGILGLTEITNDFRYVEDNFKNEENAKRAMNVYCHRLAKYISSYFSLMESHLDAVVFTGGIGENATAMRELSLNKLSILGFSVDHNRNLMVRFGKSGLINKEGTRPILIIPSNEELVIARDTVRLTT